MNSKILGVLAVVVLIIVLGSIFFLNKNTKTAPANTNPNTQNNTNVQKPTGNKIVSIGVTVTSNGFEPKDLSIKARTQVVWTNKSGEPVTVNSDNHPTHLLWPFLNLGEFDNGQSVSVVFPKSGKYTYHNHLNPSQTGSVTVK